MQILSEIKLPSMTLMRFEYNPPRRVNGEFIDSSRCVAFVTNQGVQREYLTKSKALNIVNAMQAMLNNWND